MRYVYNYPDLIDYLESRKDEKKVKADLIAACDMAISSNYDSHNKGVVMLNQMMKNAGVARVSTTYERGYLNIRQMVDVIKEVCA